MQNVNGLDTRVTGLYTTSGYEYFLLLFLPTFLIDFHRNATHTRAHSYNARPNMDSALTDGAVVGGVIGGGAGRRRR